MMVVISLKSQYVSLIITLLSFFSELSILIAFLELNNYRQCRRLTRGKTVNIRHHRRYGKITAMVAGLVFLTLEITASFLSDPARIERFGSHTCVAIDTSIVIPKTSDNLIQEEIVENRCQSFDDPIAYQYLGNYSLDSEEVRCSKEPVFKSKLKEELNKTIPKDAVLGCVPMEEEPGREICSFVFHRNNSVYFSVWMVGEKAEAKRISNKPEYTRFLRTDILFEGKTTMSHYAVRAAQAFHDHVTDVFELRRRVFLGVKKSNCPFIDKITDGTEVPLVLIYVLAVIWVLSVLLFIISIALFHRRIFFNFADPLDWALHTRQRLENPAEYNPVLSCDSEKGNQVLYVSEMTVTPTDVDMNNREIWRQGDD